jgi:hypothetical protein
MANGELRLENVKPFLDKGQQFADLVVGATRQLFIQ